jgi:hypothetical protein
VLDWLVHERGIEPYIPVFDKSKRADDTFSRGDFAYDAEADTYSPRRRLRVDTRAASLPRWPRPARYVS